MPYCEYLYVSLQSYDSKVSASNQNSDQMSEESDIREVFAPRISKTTVRDLYDLAKWMKSEGANFNSYCIVDLTDPISEGHEITGHGSSWFYRYTERGTTDIVASFPTSAELVFFAYDKIRLDPWAWVHCVAMVSSNQKRKEVAAELARRDIAFYSDIVPAYDSVGEPMHRVFVFGNDRHKVNDIRHVEHFSLN